MSEVELFSYEEHFPCYAALWGAAIPAECTRLAAWVQAMQGRESHKRTVSTIEYHIIRYRRYDQAA